MFEKKASFSLPLRRAFVLTISDDSSDGLSLSLWMVHLTYDG